MVYIAVLGYGTVGSGVIDVITNHTENISKRAKEDIAVKYVLVRHDYPQQPAMGEFVQSFDTIINDPEIKIIVECIGGMNPAYEYVKKSLEAGKSVVTSNKELVAMKGAELLSIAKEKNLNFLFEASVGGGIPIIRPISQCLSANDFVEICGILNGTTNFILTKMIRENLAFDDALKIAQDLGYAEHDPTADVEGIDTCRKICILASLTYGHHVYPDMVHTEGITKITAQDVEYANSWHGVIKLLGEVKLSDDNKLQLIVAPMFVSSESQLANVDDVFNAIMVRGDSTGDVVFYGKGAGKFPTASAVVADVIDCVKHFKARKYLFWDDGSKDYVDNYLNSKRQFYVRTKTENNEEKNIINDVFTDLQILNIKNSDKKEFAFVTSCMKESEFNIKMDALKQNGIKIINTIRVADV